MSWFNKKQKINPINRRGKEKDEFNGLSLDKRLREMMDQDENELNETCSKCGNGMVKLARFNKVVCPSCLAAEKEANDRKQESEWSKTAIKAMSRAYFNDYSILKNSEIKKAGFKNFVTTEEQADKAKNIAKRFIRSFLDKEVKHMVLSGKPGRGKTHIAMATARSIIEMCPKEVEIMFIHYSAFLEFKKKSFSQDDLQLKVAQIETAMMDCDLLVIDDLGVELGSLENPKKPTDWNLDVLTLIMDAREDKPLIVTTNFDESQIIDSYEDRNKSRMFKHSNGFRIQFSNITDKRKDM